jgi:teichuronic acid biosynthesis glycosyltransferase TuaC
MKQLRKVLFVTPYVGRDTPESFPFAKLLMAKVAEQGIEVRNLLVTKTANPLFLARERKELRSLVKTFQPDVVVANYGTFTGLFVAVFARGPKVIVFRGTDLNPSPEEPRILRIVQYLTSHVASFLVDAFVCVSKELAGRLIAKRPCTVFPDPIDLELFRPLDRESCRSELGWDPNKPIAVFFGYGFRAGKGLGHARRIQQGIANSGSNVEFKVLSNWVRREQMPVYLNAADCLLFLSDFEGSPNLVREACACNLPIVTVPVGDVREVLAEVRPAEVVEREDSLLIEALARVTLMRTRSNGRMHVEQYSGDRTAKKLVDFLSKVFQERSENS